MMLISRKWSAGRVAGATRAALSTDSVESSTGAPDSVSVPAAWFAPLLTSGTKTRLLPSGSGGRSWAIAGAIVVSSIATTASSENTACFLRCMKAFSCVIKDG